MLFTSIESKLTVVVAVAVVVDVAVDVALVVVAVVVCGGGDGWYCKCCWQSSWW